MRESLRLLISSDFYAAYRCMARIDGVDPLWCWAHIRRRFIRAGDAHRELRVWSDAWVARIADLYTTHTDLATAEIGTTEHTTAKAAFDAALAAIDTARHDEIRNADLMHWVATHRSTSPDLPPTRCNEPQLTR